MEKTRLKRLISREQFRKTRTNYFLNTYLVSQKITAKATITKHFSLLNKYNKNRQLHFLQMLFLATSSMLNKTKRLKVVAIVG
jgi:hypothetical protein